MTVRKASYGIEIPLALHFMLLLSAAMLSLSVLFVLGLRFSVTWRQDAELRESIGRITHTLETDGAEELAFTELAYYITYVVYDDSGAVLATNDSLLPLLDSGGKCRSYFQKGYFTDGDLNIRYLTRRVGDVSAADGISAAGGSNAVDGGNAMEGGTTAGTGSSTNAAGSTTADGVSTSALTVECALDIANDSAAKMLSAVPLLALIALIPVLLISFAISFLISRSTLSAFRRLQAEYDREKAFSSNVSHELKTPISIIDGHANLLKRWGKDDPAQLEQSIDAILHETETMNAIVTTLLEMSRLEQGHISVQKERFFVTNLFASLKEEFCALYPALRVIISDPDFIELESDVQKLHQIFTVIMANSIKFAGKDCCITLSCRRAGNRTELSAADNGSGFAPQVLPHVFERFYKGDASHRRDEGGAGLGLSIAQALVQALGGSIRAANTESGGAVIVVTL